MSKSLLRCLIRVQLLPIVQPPNCPIRHFSCTIRRRTPYTEHVQVPCASSGDVTVSLHDIAKHPALAPLVINLPAHPVKDIAHVDSYLPHFLHRYPSATIHYRWPQRGHSAGPSSSQEYDDAQHVSSERPLYWPTPIHDTLAAFDFVTHTLAPTLTDTTAPSRLQRRHVYVYGSYLGASLAASLSLTESHTHEPMAVKGLLAVNGIYNWTTFLPDHPINTTRHLLQKELGFDLAAVFERRDDNGEDVGMLKSLLPRLFKQPANLFDPFASPVLFFHTAGILVPPSFTERWRPEYLADSPTPSTSAVGTGSDAMDPYDYVYSDPEDPPPPPPFSGVEPDTGSDAETDPDLEVSAILSDPAMATTPPRPRKGYLAFPPRASTLKLPETLLLHSTPPPLPDTLAGQKRPTALWKRLKNAENSFGSQALGLAGLMRRSVNKLELRERTPWNEELEHPHGEAARRIQTGDIGGFAFDRDAAEEAEEKARQWLEERLG